MSNTVKRSRKTSRKLTDRERTQRQFDRTKTQLKHARESRDNASDEKERESWSNLVKVYSSSLEQLNSQLSSLDHQAGTKRQNDAKLAAWRNMGKALPSKTLKSDTESFNQFRDTIAETASKLGKEYAQAFLAGVGTGLNDLSKTKRAKKQRTDTSFGETHRGEDSDSDGEGEEVEVEDKGNDNSKGVETPK